MQVPVPFVKMIPREKEKVMLSWFVRSEFITQVINEETLIDEKMLIFKNSSMQHSALADDYNFNLVRKYFTSRGWRSIESIIKK